MAALDLGEARTGVAVSDPTRSLATPLEVVASEEIGGRLKRLVDEEGVGEVVVGVPRTMSGETGFQAERALAGIQRLREDFPGVSFVEWDERLTTKLSSQDPQAPGGNGKKRGNKSGKKRGGRSKAEGRVDHLAAARILQEYLDLRG